MKKFTVLFLCMAVGISNGLAQKRIDKLLKVRGTVTVFRNFYVKNATISAKKTKTKALTDTLGRFEIMAMEDDILLFEAAGFINNRRKLEKGMDSLNVNLILKNGEKDRKIAVGYGHISEKELTYASTHYENLNNDYLKYGNIASLLRAEIPGAKIDDQNGIKVFLRGSENILNPGLSENTGAALFVVDGIVYPDINFLNIEDIQSIDVMKGPEAAIYGTRGANGVVLISTTK